MNSIPPDLIASWDNVPLNNLSAVAASLKKQMKTPTVVLLSGEMGTGKTTFVSAFAPLLGHTGPVPSPTYALIHDFDLFLHADFYRLRHKNELTDLEWPLYLKNKRYIFIEWGRSHIAHLKDEFNGQFFLYELSFTAAQGTTRHLSLTHFTLWPSN